jgi:hypothetical protein
MSSIGQRKAAVTTRVPLVLAALSISVVRAELQVGRRSRLSRMSTALDTHTSRSPVSWRLLAS